MKKVIFIIMLFTMLFCANINAQNYIVSGNNYSSVKKSSTAAEPENTGFTWTDSKNNTYPIYISSTGSCFVIKTSSKTGKQYRNYLGKEISQDICNKLGKKYQTKK